MNVAVTIRPRTLANLLADLTEARGDLTAAEADFRRYPNGSQARADAHDRMIEAETRQSDMRAEFDVRFAEVNGLSVEDIRGAFADAVI